MCLASTQKQSAPRADFARLKLSATIILVAMAVCYAATLTVAQPSGWLTLIRAMAGGGLVGGLADWFAVTALFRHPLGIPIPHTALLVRKQSRAARRLGRLFRTHFLTPNQVASYIRELQPANRIAERLVVPENAERLARELSALAAASLVREPPKRVQARTRRMLRELAGQLGSDQALATSVAQLVKMAVHNGAADELIGHVRSAIDEHRELALALVQEKSRWWINPSIDRWFAEMLVTAVLEQLAPSHLEKTGLRLQFESLLVKIVDDLEAEGALARAVCAARDHMIESGGIDDALQVFVQEARRKILADPNITATALAHIVRDLARGLQNDPATLAAMNDKLAAWAGTIATQTQEAAGDYVDNIISGWSAEDLVARFEEEIGADLQFIRINGALLGALLGAALFGVEVAAASLAGA